MTTNSFYYHNESGEFWYRKYTNCNRQNKQLLEEKIDIETKLYKANEELLMQTDYDEIIKQNEENEIEIINLKKENKKLKKQIKKLNEHCLSHNIEYKSLYNHYRMLKKKNGQLKQEINIWKEKYYLAQNTVITETSNNIEEDLIRLHKEVYND